MLARAPFEDVLEEIASGDLSSGSGTAAACALAMGIACLRKAIAVSLHHPPIDPALHDSAARLCALQDRALAAAKADAVGFPRLVRARPDGEKAQAADDLVALADRFTWLCAQLMSEAERLAPLLRANMANDILAARRLADAASAIMEANGSENAGDATEGA
ncbi:MULTISPECIES: cyclodeaminase/cyclohydrolase family protein [Sphingobium]|uniref:cyclodeaminase/cyclohydrolase family protein n=1 Tax=Sphingobium TaxID=165695 RepID=UPI0015EB887B|nr:MULTISPECIES: cyclodeaminase/cyclohydrolase family protein [Sphingobium]MCW2363656.1 formiminotetrahydrofolate cyclodeaminase [Sphingobium sp. B10D3B]MCW2402946.1 formiminotetrahydrofolate cyclodeaminase [Sphingobium sp. B10D7B]MCW2409924.1 formiminotetrahydrofolate cyclodeaminase [Sphingobium xanthum]